MVEVRFHFIYKHYGCMEHTNNHYTPTWTKYICTIGPASDKPEVLEGLITSGANFFRRNFAHAQYDEYKAQKVVVDGLNKKHGTNVWLQADLQGRNIRVQRFSDDPKGGMQIEAGQIYTFYTTGGPAGEAGEIRIDDDTLHQDVKAGEPIVFADGEFDGVIQEVKDNKIVVKMTTGGFLKNRKSINVPASDLKGSSITEKDKRDLEFLMEAGVDWVAVSFISSAEEMNEVRQIIGDRPIKLIAKVERMAALKNLDAIVAASDAVMIARGDLGIELPMEEVPIVQHVLTDLCAHAGKPVITATQMMLSTASALRPTRAEVSDVANAVFDRSDALMLSEETAAGINPVNSLNLMVRVAKRAEEYLGRSNNFFR
jgi:pyruvate kinase